MQTKLTLRLDHQLIEMAKEYARAHDQSVSQLVANFFVVLTQAGVSQSSTSVRPESRAPQVVQELHGCLAGAEFDEGDYRRYLEERYGS